MRERERVASDVNESVIMMWKGLQDGSFWPPSCVSKEEHRRLRYDENPSALKGYAGTVCSQMGYWFGGLIKYSEGGRKNQGDLGDRHRNGIRERLPRLRGVSFYACSYEAWSHVEDMLIYCDPPYAGTSAGVYESDDFDSEVFWEWCRKMSKRNSVFVSEQEAPKDFKSVWSMKRVRTGVLGAEKSLTENLFTCR